MFSSSVSDISLASRATSGALWLAPVMWVMALGVFAYIPPVTAAPRALTKVQACKPRSQLPLKGKAGVRARGENSAPMRGKAAVFSFEGDDVEPLREEVVRLFRAKGLQVNTTLRPVDTPEQYRDMSVALGLAVYVHGQLKPRGPKQAVATIVIRSGITGRPIASAKIAGDLRTLPTQVANSLWYRVSYAITRACMSAAKPGRRHNQPLHIEAGTPIENSPWNWERS